VRAQASAEQQTRRANEVTKVLLDAFNAADPGRNGGEKVSARQVLDQAVFALQKPHIDVDTRVALNTTLSKTYSAIGLRERAVDLIKVPEDLHKADRLTQIDFWHQRAELAVEFGDTLTLSKELTESKRLLIPGQHDERLIVQRFLELKRDLSLLTDQRALEVSQALSADATSWLGASHPVSVRVAIEVINRREGFEPEPRVLEWLNQRLYSSNLDKLDPTELEFLRKRSRLLSSLGKNSEAVRDAESYVNSVRRLYGTKHRLMVSALTRLAGAQAAAAVKRGPA
jgi:hypothetical protein